MIAYVTLGMIDLHRAAACEGPAGPREGGFYAGYFRDLDGNKLCVFNFQLDS